MPDRQGAWSAGQASRAGAGTVSWGRWREVWRSDALVNRLLGEFVMMGKKSIVVKNAISELEPLAAEVSGWCRQNGLIGDIDHELNLVLDEIVSNVIRHGYRDNEEHQILIILSLDQDEVTIQIEDDGVHFNPLMAPPADITKPVNERSGGGLGIHLVRQIMDGLEYRIEKGKNFLVMKKRRTG